MGEYEFKPHDFYQLSFQEVVWIQRGREKKELNDLYKLRFVAYSSAIGNLKEGTTIEKFFPLDGDKPTMDKTRLEKILQRYRDAGYLKPDVIQN